MQDHCLVRSSMRHAITSCTLQRLARTNDTAREGSMTMHVLGRPSVARRLAKTFAAVGAVAAVLVGMTASALPAGAKTHQPTPTYTVRTILSGKSLHHWYTKAGSKVRQSEPLTKPDD